MACSDPLRTKTLTDSQTLRLTVQTCNSCKSALQVECSKAAQPIFSLELKLPYGICKYIERDKISDLKSATFSLIQQICVVQQLEVVVCCSGSTKMIVNKVNNQIFFKILEYISTTKWSGQRQLNVVSHGWSMVRYVLGVPLAK